MNLTKKERKQLEEEFKQFYNITNEKTAKYMLNQLSDIFDVCVRNFYDTYSPSVYNRHNKKKGKENFYNAKNIYWEGDYNDGDMFIPVNTREFNTDKLEKYVNPFPKLKRRKYKRVDSWYVFEQFLNGIRGFNRIEGSKEFGKGGIGNPKGWGKTVPRIKYEDDYFKKSGTPLMIFNTYYKEYEELWQVINDAFSEIEISRRNKYPIFNKILGR